MTIGVRRLAAALFLLATSSAFGQLAATITFTPAAPRAGDVVAIHVDAGWSDSCHPTRAAARLSGHAIVIETLHPDSTCNICQAAGTPYSVDASLRLPADVAPGRYSIEYYTERCSGEVRLDTVQQIYLPNGSCNFGDSLIVQPTAALAGQPLALTWCDPGGATSYRVYTSRSASGPFSSMAEVAAGATSFRVTPVQTGPLFFYVEARRAGEVLLTDVVEAQTVAANHCLPSATVLCLEDGRFGVSATWKSSNDLRVPGRSGSGRAERLTDASGYFWFFDRANVELTVKMLNPCSIGAPARWFFAAGMTNLGIALKVRDFRGTSRHYDTAVGATFQPIIDTTSFPCN